MRLVYSQHINVLQAAYRQVQVGALDEDVFDVFWAGILSLDYIAEAWPSMRYSYDPEFADFFEELLVAASEGRRPAIGWGRRGRCHPPGRAPRSSTTRRIALQPSSRGAIFRA